MVCVEWVWTPSMLEEKVIHSILCFLKYNPNLFIGHGDIFLGVKKPATFYLQRQSSQLPPSSAVVLPCSRCPTIVWRCWVSEQRLHGWSIGPDEFGFYKSEGFSNFPGPGSGSSPARCCFQAGPHIHLCICPLGLSTGACLRRAARLDNTLSVQDHDRLEAVGSWCCVLDWGIWGRSS